MASNHLQNHWLGNAATSTALFETKVDRLVNNALAPDPFQSVIRTWQTGSLQVSALDELSGLAASRRNPGVYWAINDSGNQSRLFAIDRTGRHVASHVVPVRNRDWEDISVFEDNGDSWLLIADTGDNLRRRSYSILYIFKEPDIQMAGKPLPLHRKIVFAYDGGPENVESVSVSVSDRAIYFLGKGSGSAGLYTLPLDVAPDAGLVTASKVASLDSLPWGEGASWWEQAFASRVLMAATSMDISADERLAIIGNYRYVYLFRRDPDQNWAQALTAKPQIITSHRLAQSESVAFSVAGDTVLVGSEGRHAPILLVAGTSGQRSTRSNPFAGL